MTRVGCEVIAMLEIRWNETPEEYESLAVCLRALLAGRGRDVPYEELVATLGLGAAMVAVPEDCVGWWPTHARDAALAQTAKLYGLRLRELHPADAAAGLQDSAEFEKHFEDSYRPLIERALEHGQPALAWRGWADPLERMWGIIVAKNDEHFSGHTIWNSGQPTNLTSAAFQVYVVEDCQPPKKPIAPDKLFTHAAQIAIESWNSTLCTTNGVDTGRRAYATWHDALLSSRLCRKCGERPGHRCLSQLTWMLISARRHLAKWLHGVATKLSGDARTRAEHWATACDQVLDKLQPIAAPEALHMLLVSPAGAEEVTETIEAVCAIDGEAMQALAR